MIDSHVREPGGLTHAFQLSRETIKIGRMATAHLQLPHSSVSRMHAVIELEPDATKIIDLGSSSGTHVNGVQIVKHLLQPGDELQMGDYRVRVGGPFPESAENLFERYVAAALAYRAYDPVVVRVNERIGDPEFHVYMKLCFHALRMEGKRFTIDTHVGLRNAIRDLIR